jgi:hypothetical protein
VKILGFLFSAPQNTALYLQPQLLKTDRIKTSQETINNNLTNTIQELFHQQIEREQRLQHK